MKKMFIKIITFIILILTLVLYLYNDGFYVIDKNFLSQMDFISKYTELDFSDNTHIESFQIERDYNSLFISHNEVLEAKLVVPEESIDIIFPEKLRSYNKEHINLLDVNMKDVDSINFNVFIAKRVDKWGISTQRTVHATVMEAVNGQCIVYIYVDKLGWDV